MPNHIETAKLFQTSLDKQVAFSSVTAYMEPNAAGINYSGGDTVKMPSISVDGLANYDRSTGHKAGEATLVWEDYKLTQDRGRKFTVDTMDEDESAFQVSATNIMSEFQTQHVIPEIDAYRLAAVAGKAKTAGYVTAGGAIAEDDLLDALLDDLAALEDRAGTPGSIRVHLSAATRRKLSKSKRAVDLFGSATFQNGLLKTQVTTLNDAVLIPTQQRLLNTGITIKEDDGWAPTVGAERVNWLITSGKAALAVSKTDVPRIFDPVTNQEANAWRIDYRKFHDVWVLKNQLKGIHVNTGATIE